MSVCFKTLCRLTPACMLMHATLRGCSTDGMPAYGVPAAGNVARGITRATNAHLDVENMKSSYSCFIAVCTGLWWRGLLLCYCEVSVLNNDTSHCGCRAGVSGISCVVALGQQLLCLSRSIACHPTISRLSQLLSQQPAAGRPCTWSICRALQSVTHSQQTALFMCQEQL